MPMPGQPGISFTGRFCRLQPPTWLYTQQLVLTQRRLFMAISSYSRIVRFSFIVLLGITAFSANTRAQADSHEDAALEFLESMNMDNMMDLVYDQIVPSLEGIAGQIGVTEEQRPIFDKYLVRMIEIMRDVINWEKMKPHMISAYVDVYSESELRELTEFYRSPLGQKFVEKMPELLAASTSMTQELMKEYLPRMQQLQKEMQAELQVAKQMTTNGAAEN